MSPRTPALPHRGLATAILVGVVLLSAAPAVLAASGPTTPGPATTHHGAATPTSAEDVLVVDGDADGDDAYASIQAAVDAADGGDTVAVRPGTYAATVRLNETVTVVARRGATLDGSSLDDDDATAFTVAAGSGAAPTLAGFTVTGYSMGVDATETTGDWTVRNVTLRDNGIGVDADHATGDWTVTASSVTGHKYGVFAWYASGEWTVRDSTFRANQQGIYAARTTGDWVVANSTFRVNTAQAIDATASAANWTVRDSAFLDNQFAVSAEGVYGHWTVANNAFAGSNFSAIWATDARIAGDATGNWWGNPDGADADDCIGNVTCSEPLTEAPVDGEAYRGRVDDERNIREADAGRWDTSANTTTSAETEGIGGGLSRSSGPLLSRGMTLLVVAVVFGVPLLLLRRYGLPQM